MKKIDILFMLLAIITSVIVSAVITVTVVREETRIADEERIAKELEEMAVAEVKESIFEIGDKCAYRVYRWEDAEKAITESDDEHTSLFTVYVLFEYNGEEEFRTYDVRIEYRISEGAIIPDRCDAYWRSER